MSLFTPSRFTHENYRSLSCLRPPVSPVHGAVRDVVPAHDEGGRVCLLVLTGGQRRQRGQEQQERLHPGQLIGDERMKESENIDSPLIRE